MLMYGRNQSNIVKQLSFNSKYILKNPLLLKVNQKWAHSSDLLLGAMQSTGLLQITILLQLTPTYLQLCTSATSLWMKGRRKGLRTGTAVKSKRPLPCTPLSPLWLLCFFKSVSKVLSNLTIPRLKCTLRGKFFTHLVYILTVLRLSLGPHNTEQLYFIWSGLSGQCLHPMYVSCVC